MQSMFSHLSKSNRSQLHKYNSKIFKHLEIK